jgi:DNA-binding transcriptional MocR family regulator
VPGTQERRHLLEYGNPFGYLPLREHSGLLLAELGITAHAGQVLLTQGTSQALELVIRYLLKPGDAALVDDPGYLQHVRKPATARRARCWRCRAIADGPDIATLEKLAAAHRPKVYFTQSVMQNPTGTDMSPHVAFKVLQARRALRLLRRRRRHLLRSAGEGHAAAGDARSSSTA